MRGLIDRTLRTRDPTGPELIRADSILEPFIADARGDERVGRAAVGGVAAVLFGVLVSGLSALLFGRLPFSALFEIAVTDRRGRRCSRFRLLLRTILTLITILIIGVLGFLLATVMHRVMAGLGLPTLLRMAPGWSEGLALLVATVSVIGAIAAWFIWSPGRAPQDFIARTWLVPE